MKRILSVLVVMSCIVCACFTTAFKSGEDQSKSGCLNLTLKLIEDGKLTGVMVLSSNCTFTLWYDDGEGYRKGTYVTDGDSFNVGDFRQIVFYDESGNNYQGHTVLDWHTSANTIHMDLGGYDFQYKIQ